MSSMARMVWALAGVALFGLVGLHANQSPAPRASQLQSAQPATPAVMHSALLDRALLDQYCVTCHNEKLKTAGLLLDKLNVTEVAANAEALERVAHKLRTGEMPPAGRPRPDKATSDAFATALEAALDQSAAAAPNPGRLAVHRLNRLEYVSAIHDLLALDIDPALLPADNGGVGFDNNA